MVAAVLLAGSLLAGCGATGDAAPKLAMPDLVGQTIDQAEDTTYGVLHTSLIYYDLAPANRNVSNKWVIVETQPAAGRLTAKYDTVYAWALQASEYAWFKAHATMPAIPTGTSAAKLLGPGGLLAPVKDLVQLRYAPGHAPTSAKPSPVDAKAFTPDRGLHPDLATEPASELALRHGLRVAPAAGTVVAGVRPAAGTGFRVGQYLVVLVVPAPKKKHPANAPVNPTTSDGTSTHHTKSGGTKLPGGGTIPGGGLPGGVTIPKCPQQICG